MSNAIRDAYVDVVERIARREPVHPTSQNIHMVPDCCFPY